jgi:hypothetical protein
VVSILGLDRKAVMRRKPRRNQLGPLFLDHTLAVISFAVVFDQLADSEHFEELIWADEFSLKAAQYKRPSEHLVPYWMEGDRRVRSYPDAYFAFQFSGADEPASAFLEVDRGTVSTKRWRNRIKAYLNFRESGLAKQHYNSQNFRVLTVTTSPQRLKHLVAATEKAAEGDDYAHHFWFTVEEHVDIWQPEKLLGPIWRAAAKPQEEIYTLI